MMPSSHYLARVGVALALSFVSLSTLDVLDAHAQETELTPEQEAVFQERLSKGSELYKAGKLAEALPEFEAAYAIKPNPKLLFNIGLIHERLGNLSEAVDYFEKFVVAPDVPLELRAKANERLAVLRPIVESKRKDDAKKIAEEDAERERREAEAREKKEKEDEAKRLAAEKDGKNKNDPDSSSSDKGGAGPLVGLTLLGVGVAAGATGGFLLATLDDEMAFASESTPDARRDARDSRRRNLNLGVGLAAGGGALAAVGTVVWLTTRKSGGEKEPQTLLLPSASPDGSGGVILLRRF